MKIILVNGSGIILLIVPITFLITTLIIFLEYPIYFKYGYAKGKTLASIPFKCFFSKKTTSKSKVFRN